MTQECTKHCGVRQDARTPPGIPSWKLQKVQMLGAGGGINRKHMDLAAGGDDFSVEGRGEQGPKEGKMGAEQEGMCYVGACFSHA